MSFNILGWQRFRTLYLPAVLSYLVTGWVTAAGGAWNASIVSEYVTVKADSPAASAKSAAAVAHSSLAECDKANDDNASDDGEKSANPVKSSSPATPAKPADDEEDDEPTKVIQVDHGLGAQISAAAGSGNFSLLAANTLVMSMIVVIFNRSVWRRIYRLAEERYSLNK